MTDNKTAAAPLTDETFKNFLPPAQGGERVVQSYQDFRAWKEDFLASIQNHLDPVGTATAREADDALFDQLEALSKACQQTQTLVAQGKITPEATSVAGQRTLNELTTSLKTCETSIEDFVPKTKSACKSRGYTKFELAAVLVRDGFRVYGLMSATKECLATWVTEGGALSEILQPNQLTIVMYYFRSLEAFEELMADLGMYQVMKDCVEIYKIRPRSKKKKKFDRTQGNALDASSGEDDNNHSKSKSKRSTSKQIAKQEEAKEEEATDLINDGRMFENKHKDGGPKKVRAIMDKGWSNGLAPGEQIKGPTNKKHNKSKSTTSKKKKIRRNKSKSSSKNAPEGNKDGGASSDDNDELFEEGTNGTGTGNSKNGKSSSSKNNDKYNTDTTDDCDDDEEEEGSSSEEEEEDSDDDEDDDEDDYIYYFDPVRKIVGKLSRQACADEQLILTVNPSTGKESFDGLVTDWETSNSNSKAETGGDENDAASCPGKSELITTMKEILWEKAQ